MVRGATKRRVSKDLMEDEKEHEFTDESLEYPEDTEEVADTSIPGLLSLCKAIESVSISPEQVHSDPVVREVLIIKKSLSIQDQLLLLQMLWPRRGLSRMPASLKESLGPLVTKDIIRSPLILSLWERETSSQL